MTHLKPLGFTSVLVAEDDEGMRLLLQKALRQAGYDVVTCANGRHAITAMEEAPIDVLITDIEMPQVDGLQLLAWTKEHRPAVHRFAISGGASTPVFAQCLKLGAARCFRKPFVLSELLTSVQHTLSDA